MGTKFLKINFIFFVINIVDDAKHLITQHETILTEK